MLRIPALERLVHELKRLPGIGPKTAQRLAYRIMRNPEGSQELRKALQLVEEQVTLCPQCFSFSEKSLCYFCQEPSRNDEIICVVEEPMDIVGIESSGAFKGRYHVLHGAISPLEGVSPDDLYIDELVFRVKNSKVQEIILALDADIEGDTTVLYLARILGTLKQDIKLTRIAHGVPIGGDIDYVDHRTIGRALENRVLMT